MNSFIQYLKGLFVRSQDLAPPVVAKPEPVYLQPPEQTPTVHFFGTSNFVMVESIIKYYRIASGIKGERLAMGGCTSGLGLYFCAGSALAQSEQSYVVLDFQINDSQALSRGLASDQSLKQNFRDIIYHLRSQGHVPLLMILPSLGTYEAPNEMEDLQISLAQELGLPYWNLAKEIRALIKDGLPVESMMRDTAHMSVRACQTVGRQLAPALERLANSVFSIENNRFPVRDFRQIAASSLAYGKEVFTRKTSLSTSELLRLYEGDSICLPVKPHEVVTGVNFNTGAAGCVVELSNGRDSRSKMLCMRWNEATPDAYSLMYADFFDPLPPSENKVTLTLRPKDFPVSEDMLHGRQPLPDRYGVLEIVGFVIRDEKPTSREVARRAYRDLPLDMAQWPELADLQEVLRHDLTSAEAK